MPPTTQPAAQGGVDPAISQILNKIEQLTGEVRAAALVLAQIQSKQNGDLQLDRPDAGAEFLTVKQAAKKYALGERTVYRMVEDGLPVTRVGKTIRIRPRDLAKHLQDSETILR